MSKSNRSNRSNRETQVVESHEVGSIEEAGILDPATSNWDFAETAVEVETPVVEDAVVEVIEAPVEVVAAQIEFLPGLTPEVAVAALGSHAPEKKERKKRKMGRPFYAAKVLHENGGLSADLESLISKVDEECGKPNKTESLAWLKIAVQICSGWEEAKSEG